MTDVLTVGALGSVLLTRWKMIVAFVVLGVGAGVAYGMLAPATYTAKAVLFVIATPADKDGYYQAAQFAEKRAATYPALLNAPEVLDRTRSQLDLDMPASALIPMLTATNPTDSSLVEVAATAGTPQLAQQLAGAAAQNLADYAVDLETSGTKAGAVTIKLAVPARAPQYPSSPSPMVLGALGGLAGGALGVVAALATNAVRRRPRNGGSGGKDATISAAAEAPRDGTVHPSHAASHHGGHPDETTAAPRPAEPSDDSDAATRPRSTDGSDADRPDPTPDPAAAEAADATSDATSDPSASSAEPVPPAAPTAVSHPRKRKRRRAHAPAGPVRDVAAGTGSATTDAADLPDHEAAPPEAPPADVPPTEGSSDVTTDTRDAPHDDDRADEAGDHDGVEPGQDDRADEAADVQGPNGSDGAPAAGPTNGRPAPGNGQPRGGPLVRGGVGTPPPRKGSLFRPRTSARGR